MFIFPMRVIKRIRVYFRHLDHEEEGEETNGPLEVLRLTMGKAVTTMTVSQRE